MTENSPAELDDLQFDYPSEATLAREPRKCRRHHFPKSEAQAIAWSVPVGVCRSCGHIFNEVAARRGRTNRSRGNQIEREVGKKLGLRRVGQFGGPDDLSGAMFAAQVKSGGAFSERFWAWLKAVPAKAGQVALLVVTDAPGPGHRRRGVVVLDLDDWSDLHRQSDDEIQPVDPYPAGLIE